MSRFLSRFDWSRLLLGGGIGYVFWMLAAGALFPEPPGGDVTAGHVPTWLAAHANTVMTQDVLRSFAALSGMAFALGVAMLLRSRLPERSPFPWLVLIGAFAQCLLVLVAQGVDMGEAVASSDPSLHPMIRFSSFVSDELLDVTGVCWALYLAAAGLGILQSGAAPRLLGVYALLIVPFQVAGTFVPAVNAAYFLAPVAMLAGFIWLVAGSITFLVVSRRGAPAAKPALAA